MGYQKSWIVTHGESNTVLSFVTIHHKWAVKSPLVILIFLHICREHVVRMKMIYQWPSYDIRKQRYGSSKVIVDRNVKQRKTCLKFRKSYIFHLTGFRKCRVFFCFFVFFFLLESIESSQGCFSWSHTQESAMQGPTTLWLCGRVIFNCAILLLVHYFGLHEFI